jgi:hypothetical protein
LAFFDRLRVCVAGLHDTHLRFALKKPLPGVFTGLELLEAEGKVVISRRNTRVLSYVRAESNKAVPHAIGDGILQTTPDLLKILSIGNQILKIDGEEVETVIQRFIPYINSSSPEFARLRAVRFLLARDFAYPKKNYVTLTVKLADKSITTIHFPWFVVPEYRQRYDTKKFFNDLEIGTIDQLKWEFSKEKNDWVPVGSTVGFEGYEVDAPMLPTSERATLVTYADSTGKKIFRFNTFVAPNGHGVCYLQILGFAAAANKVAKEGGCI